MLNINDKLHGFTVNNIKEINAINATMIEMVHDQTKAELIWLKRDDINKTFAIAFKTIPSDDTGVFHILEHSVLNGSKKYPVKEPFVELLKGSLQTYLNAMTFADKTVYPVSSRNNKDFHNLMEVYLDAVFNPLIYENPNIFYQEGWHYEIHEHNEDPIYKGVVFNEMKGSYSSVDEIMIAQMDQMIFRDNAYRFSSGGDPKEIPNLTYESFLDHHRRFYHPSNAKIWLDGDLNIDEALALINDEYLSKYTYQPLSFDLTYQKDMLNQEREIDYAIGEDEDEKDKAYYVMGKIVSDYKDIIRNTALHLIGNVLTDSNDAPLIKTIIDNNLGKDVSFYLMDGRLQSALYLVIRNTNVDKFEKIKPTIDKLFKELADNGLNHDKIKALIDYMEFKDKEVSEPAGLIYGITCLKSWLYGGDPSLYLETRDIYDELRKKLDEGYFEEVLKEELLNNNLSILKLKPSKTQQQKDNEAEYKRLVEAKNAWKDVNEYIENTIQLEKWQNLPNSKEALDTLPKLSVEDVDKEPILYPYKEEIYNNVLVRKYPDLIKDIEYINMYFDVTDNELLDYSKLQLMLSLYTTLPTKKYSVEELQSMIKSILGKLNFSLGLYSPDADNNQTSVKIVVSFSTLTRNLDKANELVKEIMFNTIFDAKRIKTRLEQTKEILWQNIIEAGHAIAITRVGANSSSTSRVNEQIQGYTYYKWVEDMLNHYEKKIDDFITYTNTIIPKAYTKARLMVSVSGNEILDLVKELIDSFDEGAYKAITNTYPLLASNNEAISIPAGITYVAMGNNISNITENNGKLSVLSSILGLGYLWNEVRVLGGAYGTGLSIGVTGNSVAWSYRDPDPKQTIEKMKKIPEYLEHFDEDMETYIIGTIADSEPVLSASSKMITTDSRLFNGVSDDDKRKRRLEILNTTKDDIREYHKVMKELLDNSHITIVSPIEKINSFEEGLFDIKSSKGE